MRGFVFGKYWCYQHESGARRADAYTWIADDIVVLIDVWPASTFSNSAVTQLPAAEATYAYKPADREKWEITAPPGSVVEETIWGSRGLSLAVVRGDDGPEVVRARGFVPMSSRKWLDNFIKFGVRVEE